MKKVLKILMLFSFLFVSPLFKTKSEEISPFKRGEKLDIELLTGILAPFSQDPKPTIWKILTEDKEVEARLVALAYGEISDGQARFFPVGIELKTREGSQKNIYITGVIRHSSGSLAFPNGILKSGPIAGGSYIHDNSKFPIDNHSLQDLKRGNYSKEGTEYHSVKIRNGVRASLEITEITKDNKS